MFKNKALDIIKTCNMKIVHYLDVTLNLNFIYIYIYKEERVKDIHDLRLI